MLLLYAISTFRLSIYENSCSRNVNAMYGVFVIMALKSWNLSQPQQYGQILSTHWWPYKQGTTVEPCFF